MMQFHECDHCHGHAEAPECPRCHVGVVPEKDLSLDEMSWPLPFGQGLKSGKVCSACYAELRVGRSLRPAYT